MTRHLLPPLLKYLFSAVLAIHPRVSSMLLQHFTNGTVFAAQSHASSQLAC